jgi:hypothetical protein
VQVTEYHIDGFRFDLASILTRAWSAWHPAGGSAGELHAPGAADGDIGVLASTIASQVCGVNSYACEASLTSARHCTWLAVSRHVAVLTLTTA